MKTLANQETQLQQRAESKNYSEKQLSERFDDVTFIASILADIKMEKPTGPEPCKGYGGCCFYGDWDCDSCIAANKIYEHFHTPKLSEIKNLKEGKDGFGSI